VAITANDYVKSDAKVKAALDKLNSAKQRVSQLKGINTKEAKAALPSAQADERRLQAAYNDAAKKARDYFNANQEEIQATEEAEQAKEKQAREETVKRITGSGRVSEAEKEVISRAGKKPPVKPGQQVDAEDTEAKDQVSEVDRINAALASEAKIENATKYISGLTDDERLMWAKSLKEAGFDVLQTGTINRGLIEQYQSALNEAQAENTFYKDTKNFKPYSLVDYLAYRTGLVNVAKGGKAKTTFEITELTDVDAAAYVENVFNSEFGRKPTSAELKALVPAVKAYVRATPTKRTTGDRTRIATSGPNPVDWLTQTIRGQQKIIGFGPKNKKQEDRAKKVIGKLNQELTTRQGQTLANFSEEVLATVKNNGLSKVINQSQIQGWAKRLQNGEKLDTINREIRNIAKVGMPDSVKTLMDSGIDLDTIYSPYKKAMATVLEVNPETISLDDSVLRKAIGPTGEMPIYEFERALRQDGRWQYTNNARKEVSDAALKVLRDFGFQG
jgi:hypothetical protein